ncbi:phosphoenolpyruvate carboxylase [Aureococcus anophagefferens]|nr:phosphoenolpyruvate carboxylase [Aureococcus anophagefferens]
MAPETSCAAYRALTRLGLPAWLGIGDAFAAADGAELRAMYEEWPWFKTNVDLIETLLAKLEPEIAKHYDAVLVGGGEPRLAAPATAALRAATRRTRSSASAASAPDDGEGDTRRLTSTTRLICINGIAAGMQKSG